MDFFSPDRQYFYDDLILLPQKSARTGGTGRPPNSYAVLFEGYSILFDAPFSYLSEDIEALAKEGHLPKALVLSHGHLANQGSAIEALKDTYNLSVLLHPEDDKRRAFDDPINASVLKEAGLEPIHFPGHTPGSIMLYWPKHGGVLLAGDSAVAPGPRQDQSKPKLERPLGPTQGMTDQLAERWRSFDKPLRSVFPLHGVPYVERADLPEIMTYLYDAPPMNPAG